MSEKNVFRVRECSLTYKNTTVELPVDAGQILNTSRMAALLLHQYTAPMAGKEQAWCFHLNVQQYVVGAHLVSIGTIDTTVMAPRDVFREALASNASGIVLGHNHPGGDPRPSPDDFATTRTIKAAADALHIVLYDHVIIAPDGEAGGTKFRWYSMRSNNKL